MMWNFPFFSCNNSAVEKYGIKCRFLFFFKDLSKKLMNASISTRCSLPRVSSIHGICLLPHRSIQECEKLVKETYQRNGLVYRESSSEDEGVGGGKLSSEVIEIDDDDDDDVIAVGCCKLHRLRHSGILLSPRC